MLGSINRMILGEGPQPEFLVGKHRLHHRLEAIIKLATGAASLGEDRSSLPQVISEGLQFNVCELRGVVAVEIENRRAEQVRD